MLKTSAAHLPQAHHTCEWAAIDTLECAVDTIDRTLDRIGNYPNGRLNELAAEYDAAIANLNRLLTDTKQAWADDPAMLDLILDEYARIHTDTFNDDSPF